MNAARPMRLATTVSTAQRKSPAMKDGPAIEANPAKTARARFAMEIPPT